MTTTRPRRPAATKGGAKRGARRTARSETSTELNRFRIGGVVLPAARWPVQIHARRTVAELLAGPVGPARVTAYVDLADPAAPVWVTGVGDPSAVAAALGYPNPAPLLAALASWAASAQGRRVLALASGDADRIEREAPKGSPVRAGLLADLRRGVVEQQLLARATSDGRRR